jgi:hypothetical protein
MTRFHWTIAASLFCAAACTPSQPPPAAAPPASATAAATPTQVPTASAPPAQAASAAPKAGDETEGDESLVGLLGTYRISAHVSASVSALSDAQARAFHGKDIVIKPAVKTPWDQCDAPHWKHHESTVDAWLGDWKAPNLKAAERAALGLDKATKVTVWEADCGKGPSIEVVQTNADTVVMLHDGVAFAARRQAR